MASLGRPVQSTHRESGDHGSREDKTNESQYLCLNGIAVDVVTAVGQTFDTNDPSYLDSARREDERQESLGHSQGFDGPAVEEWKELAGIKDHFNQLKTAALSLKQDGANDIGVGQDGDQNELIAAIWSNMDPNEALEKYPTGKTKLDAFIQTLMLDNVPCQDYAPIFHERVAALRGHQRGDPFESVFFSSSLLGFRFYVTEKGYYGLAQSDLEVGDQVCILYGGKVPFLLRDIKDTKYKKLLSWTFVLGLMNGEALANTNSSISKENFCLV